MAAIKFPNNELHYNTPKRYIPRRNDAVIGIVSAKLSECYRVDIGGPFAATLDLCAFEGASRRNKPNLSIGSAVYARVTLDDKDMDPEVECMNGDGKSDGFGELKGGYVLKTSLKMAHRSHYLTSLFNSENLILTAFAEKCAYELSVGSNGMVWIKTEDIKAQIKFIDLIASADRLEPSKLPSLISHQFQNI